MQATRNARPGSASALLIAVAALWLPCAGAAEDQAGGAQAAMEKIRALIGDAACDDNAQCRTVAVGAKACGGPEYYLAWSTKRTDAAALRDAVASDGAVRRPEPPRPGVRSDCALVTDPGAYCAPSGTDAAQQQGRACRLRSARQGGSGPVD